MQINLAIICFVYAIEYTRATKNRADKNVQTVRVCIPEPDPERMVELLASMVYYRI